MEAKLHPAHIRVWELALSSREDREQYSQANGTYRLTCKEHDAHEVKGGTRSLLQCSHSVSLHIRTCTKAPGQKAGKTTEVHHGRTHVHEVCAHEYEVCGAKKTN